MDRTLALPGVVKIQIEQEHIDASRG